MSLTGQRDFDLRALYDALDEKRRAKEMSWAAVANDVNRLRTYRRPIAVSTITGLQHKPAAEGDGSCKCCSGLAARLRAFVPGAIDPESELFCRSHLTSGQILRWDGQALFVALDEQRRERQPEGAHHGGEDRREIGEGPRLRTLGLARDPRGIIET